MSSKNFQWSHTYPHKHLRILTSNSYPFPATVQFQFSYPLLYCCLKPVQLFLTKKETNEHRKEHCNLRYASTRWDLLLATSVSLFPVAFLFLFSKHYTDKLDLQWTLGFQLPVLFCSPIHLSQSSLSATRHHRNWAYYSDYVWCII